MLLTYILSILTLSSLFMNKIQPVDNNLIEDNNKVEIRTIQKSQYTQSLPKNNSWTDDNNLSGTGIENSDTQNDGDEYEEIIFDDNFDKEYRSGTENNYLED